MVLLALCSGCFSLHTVAEDKQSTDKQSTTQKSSYGRLFYSQHQRQQFDADRASPVPQRRSINMLAPRPPNAMPFTDPVTLQGYVKRSDGKSTVWVNRQPVQENARVDDMQIGKLNRQTEIQKGRKTTTQTEKLNIRIPANGQQIQLKVGQQFDPKNNQIKEVTTVAKEKQLLLSESVDEATDIE